MKTFEMIATALLLSAFAPINAALADKGEFIMNYRLPKDAVSESAARNLAAAALSKRNVEVAVCARAYDNDRSAKRDCEANAEISFRQRLAAIPGVKFGLFFNSYESSKNTLVMDLTPDEIVNRKFDLLMEHLQPTETTAVYLGLVLESYSCGFKSYNTGARVNLESRFERLVCTLVGQNANSTRLLWDMTFHGTAGNEPDLGDVAFLLSHGANANITNDKQDSSILSLAADRGLVGVMKLLISNGARINSRDNEGCSPLCNAAAKGRPEAVRLLIANGASVHSKDNEGEAPLGWAAASGSLESVRLLVEAGADVNTSQDAARDFSALMIAATHGSADIVEYLLAQGADVNFRSSTLGQNAMSQARRHGHTAVIEVLKQHGAEE